MVRVRMSRQERAKQFMPFSVLKGYEEALREKEKIVVERRELSEDKKEELDLIFKDIKTGQIITVIYYHNEEYIKLTGMVAKIDIDGGYIQVVEKKISFSDIYDLSI
jgi:alkyl sulfatase BDS1-like metallo-beta-lactamase superfamily hydrolase